MAKYTPSELAASFNTTELLEGLFATEGITTGFNYYDSVNNPGMGADVWTKFANEGFFTGHLPRRYYNPLQATALAAMSFVLAGDTMDGIEYRIRTEGVTTGDYSDGITVHSPGEAVCVILDTLATEGYASGPGYAPMIPASDGIADLQCTDGRGYGSGCLRPTIETLNIDFTDSAYSSGQWDNEKTASITLEYNYPAKVILFLHATVTDLTRDDEGGGGGPDGLKLWVNQGVTTLQTPRIIHHDTWFVDPTGPLLNDTVVGFVDIPANTPTTFEMRGQIAHISSMGGVASYKPVLADLRILVFKQA